MALSLLSLSGLLPVPGVGAGGRAAAVRHLTVEAAQILEGMQPLLVSKWIVADWLARRLGQTSRHRVRQGPPVERVPLRDQRDMAVATHPEGVADLVYERFIARIPFGGRCDLVVAIQFAAAQAQFAADGLHQVFEPRVQTGDRTEPADTAQFQLLADRTGERIVGGSDAVQPDALFLLEEFARACIRDEAGPIYRIDGMQAGQQDVVADRRLGAVERRGGVPEQAPLDQSALDQPGASTSSTIALSVVESCGPRILTASGDPS